MTTSNSETIFIKIKDPEEKKQILNDILKERRDVVIKSKETGGDVVLVEPISFVRQQLTCRWTTAHVVSNQLSESILQFGVGTEKYLALCNCVISPDSITLNLDTDIFKIQRREDFRLKLPMSYSALFQVKTLNAKKFEEELSILDISAGGCRVKINKSKVKIKNEDQIEGEIQLSFREEISVMARVKHVASDAADEDHLILGLQFENISGASKDRLVGVVMDIYKELFTRN